MKFFLNFIATFQYWGNRYNFWCLIKVLAQYSMICNPNNLIVYPPWFKFSSVYSSTTYQIWSTNFNVKKLVVKGFCELLCRE